MKGWDLKMKGIMQKNFQKIGFMCRHSSTSVNDNHICFNGKYPGTTTYVNMIKVMAEKCVTFYMMNALT
jgi:hypothetical protein